MRTARNAVAILLILMAAVSLGWIIHDRSQSHRSEDISNRFGRSTFAGVFDAGKCSSLLDPQEVIQIAKQWKGDKTLSFWEPRLTVYAAKPREMASHYTLRTKDHSQSFGINALTGEVDKWHLQPLGQPPANRRPRIPEDQWLHAARIFAEEKSPRGASLRMLRNVVGGSQAGQYGQAAFEIAGPKVSAKLITVQIDLATGKPCSFELEPVPTKQILRLQRKPCISRQQASERLLDLALAAVRKGQAILMLRPPDLMIDSDDLGGQAPHWKLYLYVIDKPPVNPKPGNKVWGMIAFGSVDAYSGEVRELSFTDCCTSTPITLPKDFGLAVKRSLFDGQGDASTISDYYSSRRIVINSQLVRLVMSPRVEKKAPYIPWIYLEGPLARASVKHESHGRLTVEHAGHRYVLQTGSEEYTQDGKKRQLEAPVLNLEGEVYVPASFLASLRGGTAGVDDPTRLVTLSEPGVLETARPLESSHLPPEIQDRYRRIGEAARRAQSPGR